MATTVGGQSVTVIVHGDLDAFMKQTELNVKSALMAMARATVERAKMLEPAVPVLNGVLSSTGIAFEENGGFTTVAQFGSGLKYGRYQEYGSPNPDQPWNYTTAGTGAFFLQTAGNSVAKEGIKNFL